MTQAHEQHVSQIFSKEVLPLEATTVPPLWGSQGNCEKDTWSNRFIQGERTRIASEASRGVGITSDLHERD